MSHDLKKYLQALHLDANIITPIIHEDTISSAVYKIDYKDLTRTILKICYTEDRYRRECYFLDFLKSRFVVPKLLGQVAPTKELRGAILMECLPGHPLSQTTLTPFMAFKMGSLLANLHLLGAERYGDLSLLEEKSDPLHEMTKDFQESLEECKGILSPSLLVRAQDYFNTHLLTLGPFDGPCIVHRDFKPGNIIVEKEKISGVIDWENAKGSFAEEDFVRMDRLLWAKNETSKAPFLSGYQAVRPLPNLEKTLPFLRILRALGAIGFTCRRKSWNLEHKSIFESNKSFLEKELFFH